MNVKTIFVLIANTAYHNLFPQMHNTTRPKPLKGDDYYATVYEQPDAQLAPSVRSSLCYSEGIVRLAPLKSSKNDKGGHKDATRCSEVHTVYVRLHFVYC